MKQKPEAIGREKLSRLYAIRRGFLGGCEAYLSKRDRFPIRIGTFEKEITEHFSKLAEGTEAFVDIGAAEGFFSMYMLRNTEAKVFVFEDSETCQERLHENLARNSTREDRFSFPAEEPEFATEPAPPTIDALVAGITGPVMIKIDAPEDELGLLEGADETLTRDDTRVLIKLPSKIIESRCMWLLDEYGFNMELVGPAWWRSFVKDPGSESGSRWLMAEKSPVRDLFC
jgi:hypothetical protein